MKRLFLISAILVAGLSSRLVGQELQPSHQPALSPATSTAVAGIAARPEAPPTPIVRVNGVALTQVQLDEEMQRLFPYYAIHGGRVPPSAEAELRKQAMHDLVLHELVYQEARRRNLQVPPSAWEKRIGQIRQGFTSREAYQAAAAKKYGSVATFERRLRRAMLVERLWDLEVTRKSVVTDQAARAYYESHKAQYVRPEAVWLQTITIKFPSTATAEQTQQARKIAEAVLVKAKAAKTYDEFGELAEQLSQDDWRVMMGDHRWVHRGTVAPDIEQAVFSLKAGETSGIVESSSGYIILRANDHQQKRQMSYTEMAVSVRQQLAMEKRDRRSKEFEQLLRGKATIEVL